MYLLTILYLSFIMDTVISSTKASKCEKEIVIYRIPDDFMS